MIDKIRVADTIKVSAGDDAGLQHELATAFRQGLELSLQKLLAARSPDEWCHAAHRLRGLAATYGAVDLAALAADAEQKGAPNSLISDLISRRITALW